MNYMINNFYKIRKKISFINLKTILIFNQKLYDFYN